MAQETNTPLETPHTSFNNIRTSSDVATAVQNKRPPIHTTENYLKISTHLQLQVIVNMLVLLNMVVKYSLWGIVI